MQMRPQCLLRVVCPGENKSKSKYLSELDRDRIAGQPVSAHRD